MPLHPPLKPGERASRGFLPLRRPSQLQELSNEPPTPFSENQSRHARAPPSPTRPSNSSSTTTSPTATRSRLLPYFSLSRRSPITAQARHWSFATNGLPASPNENRPREEPRREEPRRLLLQLGTPVTGRRTGTLNRSPLPVHAQAITREVERVGGDEGNGSDP